MTYTPTYIDLGTEARPLRLVADDPKPGEVEVIDAILRLGQWMDERNMLAEGRMVTMPEWVHKLVSVSLRPGLSHLDRFRIDVWDIRQNCITAGQRDNNALVTAYVAPGTEEI